MKKIATVLVGVALLVCVFNQSFEAFAGFSAFLAVGLLSATAVVFIWWGDIRAKAVGRRDGFQPRTTAGGFLS